MGSGTSPMVQTDFKPCDLCGAADATPIFAKFGFQIVRCRRCSLQYLHLSMTAQELQAFYSDGYFTGQEDRRGYIDYVGDRDILCRTFDDKLQRLERRHPPGSLLDIGAACGYFLFEARRRGWQGRGLEVSDYAAAEASKLGLDVVCGDSVRAFQGSTFDVVTMWDVIEHLNQPRETLAEVAELLSPDGWLLISTGDVGHPLSRLLGRHARMYAPPQHLYFYSQQTMIRLLESSGFRVRAIEPDVKYVTTDYVLHVVQGLADSELIAALARGLRKLIPNRPIKMVLWDVMVVYAQKKGVGGQGSGVGSSR